MARLVLADASPLIGLARVDGLRWLPPLFGTVWLPTEVHAEVVSGFGSADEQSIGAAVTAGWLGLCGPTPKPPCYQSLMRVKRPAGGRYRSRDWHGALKGPDTQCKKRLRAASRIRFPNFGSSHQNHSGAGGLGVHRPLSVPNATTGTLPLA